MIRTQTQQFLDQQFLEIICSPGINDLKQYLQRSRFLQRLERKNKPEITAANHVAGRGGVCSATAC